MVMPSRMQVVGLFAFVATYVALAELSRNLSFPDVFAALWLPAGFVLAVYASTSKKHWWFLIIGSVVSSLIFNFLIRGNSIGVVIGFTFANVTRSLLGALLIQKLAARKISNRADSRCLGLCGWSMLVGTDSHRNHRFCHPATGFRDIVDVEFPHLVLRQCRWHHDDGTSDARVPIEVV